MEKDLSIYVHIPFCSSKCYYCAFCSSVENELIKTRYFIALENEIKLRKSHFGNDQTVKTIYFGGGTPSVVDEKFISQILQTIRNNFLVSDNVEITIECNPNSASEKKLKEYKKIGINRLSLGVQSFNKRSLEFIGRLNTKEDLQTYKYRVIECLKQAKQIGFDNISVDFILGLPYQTNLQLKNFIKKVSKYVTHFSCYMLQVEEGTKLAQILTKGVNDDKLADQYEIAAKLLKKLGFERYEISNFAKKGKESKHNKGYWTRRAYIGFGLAAHSFYNNMRFANTENLGEYLSFWEKRKRISLEQMQTNNIISVETLTKQECAEETLMLSLRTTEGLNLKEFKENYFDLEKVHAKKLAQLIKGGFVVLEGNFLRLTAKGLLVANDIIVNFADDFIGLFIK